MMSLTPERQDSLDYNGVLSQFPATVLAGLFQALRTDGLLARGKRSNESTQVGADAASLSFQSVPQLISFLNDLYTCCSFRHFFNHRFHDAIVEQTAEAVHQLRSDRAHFSSSEETGALSVAASTMCCNQCEFDLTIPDDLIASFAQNDAPDIDVSEVCSPFSRPFVLAEQFFRRTRRASHTRST